MKSFGQILMLLWWLPVWLQTQTPTAVIGTVLSAEDRTPIAGASVLVAHTTIGTATDAEGRFRIDRMPPNRSMLHISAIGFRSLTIAAVENVEQPLEIVLQPTVVQTQTVVVTANKREQSLEEVPVSMSIVGAEAFQQRNIVALDDALRYVPGVNFQQSQVNIRASSGYSRGVGSRVLMLMDGVPLLTGDTGEITFESIPVLQVERVEIVKGAGSALYGSGALGGVINVLTRPIAQHPLVWWRIFGGAYAAPSYDQWTWSDKTRWLNGQAAGFSMSFTDFRIAASAQRLSDDGYREQDWRRKYNAFVKLEYDLSPYQSLTLTSNAFQQYRGDFLWWKNLKQALQPADAQRNISVSSLRFNSSLQYRHFVDDAFFYEVKAGHFRGNWFRDSLADRRLDESVSDALFGEVQGTLSLNETHVLIAGVTVNAERVHSNIFGIHQGNGAAAYLQDETSLSDDLSLSAGVRYDLQQIEGRDAVQQFNPKVGIRYSIGEGHVVRMSAGRGFRAPSIGEIYTSTRNTGSAAIIIPSVGLQPERSASYEISGSSAVAEHIMVEAALFHSDYHDLIEPNVQSDTALRAVTVNFRNLTQATIQGGEISLFSEWMEKMLHLDLHYNYNWAVDANSGAFLRFRPRHIASVNTSIVVGPFQAGADYRFVSRIEAIDDRLVELAPIVNGSQRVPVHLVDVRTGADLTPVGIPARMMLNVNNVLGYNYVELIGNLAPPRHVVFSIEGML